MKIAAKIVQTNIRFVQLLLFHLDPLDLIHAQGRFRQRDVNVEQTLTILSMPSLGVTTGWQRQCPSHHPKSDSVELKTDREAIGWWSISSRRPSSAASALSQSSANSSCADPAECADPHADNGLNPERMPGRGRVRRQGDCQQKCVNNWPRIRLLLQSELRSLRRELNGRISYTGIRDGHSR